jgi:predicted O-methyltransferase YrrM
MSASIIEPSVQYGSQPGSNAFHMRECPLALLDDLYRTRAVPTSDNGWARMNVYIPREEGHFLYSLVRYIKPQVTVEVGMANGLSTAFIAQALADNDQGRHIAIDPFQQTDWQGAGLALLERAGLAELVELRETFSHQALPDLERSGVRAQFAFIDGSHLFDYVLADFLAVDRILDVGGLIAFDDSDWSAVTAVIRYIVANRHYEIAYPDVIIESAPYAPTMASRVLRSATRMMPKLAIKLRPDFIDPSHELGIRGRCVVLRKLAHDDRDSQSRFHHSF